MSNTTDKLAEEITEALEAEGFYGYTIMDCDREKALQIIKAKLAIVANAINLMRPLIAAGSTHPVWAVLAKFNGIGEDE